MTLLKRLVGSTFGPLFLLGAFIALTPGCKVGPDFAPPVVSMPEVWNQELPQNAELAPQNELIDTSWWTVFQDPKLDQLVYDAANSNLDLRVTGARIMEARYARGVVAGNLFPSISTATEYTRNQISTNGNPFGFTSGSLPGFPGFAPFDLFSNGFDASWELDLFGKVRRSVEAADAEIGVAVEDHRAVAVSLFAEVASNYMDLRTIQEQIKIASRRKPKS
jgi:outer membrane protein TolC